VRIGTWNLEGKWSSHHLALLEGQECDVWLLTEVPTRASIPGMTAHRTAQAMGSGKAWAGVFSRGNVITQPDPHPATAMVVGDGFHVMSPVLPWRSCGAAWEGSTLAEMMSITLSSLRGHIDDMTVWGGDWNQALEGRDYVGSMAGREKILALLNDAGLSLPTSTLGSCIEGAPVHRPHRDSDQLGCRGRSAPASSRGRTSPV